MRLLFAEDEKSLSRAITAILKKNHYEVDAVYDGEEALAYLLPLSMQIRKFWKWIQVPMNGLMIFVSRRNVSAN